MSIPSNKQLRENKRIADLEAENRRLKTEVDTYRKATNAQALARQANEKIDALKLDGNSKSNKPSAVEQVYAKARALTEKDSSISNEDAVAQVFREDPNLYERYRDEVSIT